MGEGGGGPAPPQPSEHGVEINVCTSCVVLILNNPKKSGDSIKEELLAGCFFVCFFLGGGSPTVSRLFKVDQHSVLNGFNHENSDLHFRS